VPPSDVGFRVGWLGRLPAALAHVAVLDDPPAAVGEEGALRVIADPTGLAAGLGYVALLSLLAHGNASVEAAAAFCLGNIRSSGGAGPSSSLTVERQERTVVVEAGESAAAW
jgi:uncharacterized protein